MPDDNPGENIEKETVEPVAPPEPIVTPALPQIQLDPTTQDVSANSVEAKIQAEEDRIKRAEWWMIRLTGAIVALTLGLVVVGFLQWRVMSGQLGEMKSGGTDTHDLAVATGKQADAAIVQSQGMETLGSATKTQAAAALDQVEKLQSLTKATQDAVAVNRDALQSVQRAFVTFQQGLAVVPITNNAAPPRNTAFEFSSKLENSGTTPTRGAIQRLSWQYFPLALPIDFRFVDGGTDPSTPFILGPRGILSAGAVQVPTDGPTGLETIRNHGGHIVFWGWITYRDVFKTTQRHVTMFCLDLAEIRGVDTQTADAVRDQFMWANCSGAGLRHNCADEECNGEPYGNPTRVWPN